MFKYKSPLSRLLEGAGKAKEDETPEAVASTEDKPEPIADFNALRAALGGGNLASDTYEETDELIPEEKMPEFSEAEAEDSPEDGAEDVSLFIDEVDEIDATEDSAEPVAVEPEQDAPEQIVTLHLSNEVRVEDPSKQQNVIAETVEPEIPAEPTQEPMVEIVEPEADVVEPVAEAPEPQPEPEIQAEPVAPSPAPAEDRRSRVKTTFLGFERADTHVQDLIETAEPVAKTESVQETFPVGWLVVTQGPGRGASVTLTEGLMQIGRNDDQAIQLDFGDTGISRSNHAVIAYDPEDRKCYLGHGGKANLVRLNGKPVLSTVALSNGDLIRISETSIRFMAFCDDGFDWRDS